MSARKHTSLNLRQKLSVIADAKKNNRDELCAKYKCSKATINRILNNKDSIVEKAKTTKLSIKRGRTGACANVERALLLWFNQMRKCVAVISRNMILEEAKKIAVEMKIDFNPSSGWLHRWQKREGIVLKKVHGEGASADIDAAKAYFDSVLPDLLTNYEPSQIFNANGSGLFFRALPKTALSRKGYQTQGLKSSKERLTLLFICNASGDYKEVIVIGKSKNPRCFKNKILPLKYYSQNKPWMTQGVWREILVSLDAEMEKQRRKIILFVDNASSHKISVVLTNIDLQFLPANTTSIAQPLDQGIIHCFKSYYRQNLLRKHIAAIESRKTIGDFVKNLTIFNAMHIIKNSWWLVKPIYITNCFKKAKFLSITEHSDLEDNIVELCPDVEQQREFEDYVSCDDNLPCCEQFADEEIKNEITSDSSEDEDEEVTNNPPSSNEVLNSLNILRDFFLPNNLFSHELDNMEKNIIESCFKPQIQTAMTDFFKPI